MKFCACNFIIKVLFVLYFVFAELSTTIDQDRIGSVRPQSSGLTSAQYMQPVQRQSVSFLAHRRRVGARLCYSGGLTLVHQRSARGSQSVARLPPPREQSRWSPRSETSSLSWFGLKPRSYFSLWKWRVSSLMRAGSRKCMFKKIVVLVAMRCDSGDQRVPFDSISGGGVCVKEFRCAYENPNTWLVSRFFVIDELADQ